MTVPAIGDTNVVVHAFSNDEAKVAVSEGILLARLTISVQVISETSPEHARCV